MNLNNVTHKQFERDYINGYDAMQEEIHGMGWANARDKFNMDNPPGQKPVSLAAWYYAKGECDALLSEM